MLGMLAIYFLVCVCGFVAFTTDTDIRVRIRENIYILLRERQKKQNSFFPISVTNLQYIIRFFHFSFILLFCLRLLSFRHRRKFSGGGAQYRNFSNFVIVICVRCPYTNKREYVCMVDNLKDRPLFLFWLLLLPLGLLCGCLPCIVIFIVSNYVQIFSGFKGCS